MNTHEIVKLNTIEGLSHLKDYYHISNTGKIYSTYRQPEGELKEIAPYLVGAGYQQVQLGTKQGGFKKLYVHRLVGMVFVEGYAEGLVINHKDENKLNNHYLNLEWVTQKENINYGTRTKRQSKSCQKPLEAIDPLTGITCLVFESVREAMDKGFSANGISEASRGEWCSHLKHGGTDVYRGYKWRYV